MLETGERLTTWDVPPACGTDALDRLESFRCRALRLPDHRAMYLEYEGPISEGRGSVRRLDAGTFETLEPNRYRLSGRFFRGVLSVEPSAEEESTSLFFQLETNTNP